VDEKSRSDQKKEKKNYKYLKWIMLKQRQKRFSFSVAFGCCCVMWNFFETELENQTRETRKRLEKNTNCIQMTINSSPNSISDAFHNVVESVCVCLAFLAGHLLYGLAGLLFLLCTFQHFGYSTSFLNQEWTQDACSDTIATFGTTISTWDGLFFLW